MYECVSIRIWYHWNAVKFFSLLLLVDPISAVPHNTLIPKFRLVILDCNFNQLRSHDLAEKYFYFSLLLVCFNLNWKFSTKYWGVIFILSVECNRYHSSKGKLNSDIMRNIDYWWQTWDMLNWIMPYFWSQSYENGLNIGISAYLRDYKCGLLMRSRWCKFKTL